MCRFLFLHIGNTLSLFLSSVVHIRSVCGEPLGPVVSLEIIDLCHEWELLRHGRNIYDPWRSNFPWYRALVPGQYPSG